jgi:hypothetical protein
VVEQPDTAKILATPGLSMQAYWLARALDDTRADLLASVDYGIAQDRAMDDLRAERDNYRERLSFQIENCKWRPAYKDAEARIAAALEHHGVCGEDHDQYCLCGSTWPCLTWRALAGSTDG